MPEKKKEDRIDHLPAAKAPHISSGQDAMPSNNGKTERNRHAPITDARKASYLARDVANLLIQQIGLELNNQYLYYNFGIWCDINSFSGQAEYFYHRSGEERTHGQWIIDYLAQADYLFSIPGTDARYIDIYMGKSKLSVKEAHEEVLIREIETTRAINNIRATATASDDYITQHWLVKLLLEQAEEEELSHNALDIFEHTSDPLIVDKYFKDVVMAGLNAGG